MLDPSKTSGTSGKYSLYTISLPACTPGKYKFDYISKQSWMRNKSCSSYAPNFKKHNTLCFNKKNVY